MPSKDQPSIEALTLYYSKLKKGIRKLERLILEDSLTKEREEKLQRLKFNLLVFLEHHPEYAI